MRSLCFRFKKIRFTPFDWLFFLVLPLSSSCFALGTEDDFFLRDLAKQQQTIMKSEQALPEWLRTKPMAIDQGLTELLTRKPQSETGKTGGKHVQSGRWIFVSFGMPDEELLASAKEAAEAHAVLVFRGIKEGENTGTLALRLARLTKGIKPTPGAVIDPLLFTKHTVKNVPTLVSTDAVGNTKKVAGLPSFSWLENQDAGDSGQKGSVYAITEPDMIVEIQRRIAMTDWQSQKNNAMNNVMRSLQTGIDLPVATKSDVRYLDPSIEVTQDIFHPNGQLIASKGERLNPQTLMPMQHDYIVFDATKKDQVDWVKRLQGLYSVRKKPLVFLFSRIKTENGWEDYNSLATDLSGPVYQLNAALMNRFQIKALPTLIEGHGDKLAIREILTTEKAQ